MAIVNADSGTVVKTYPIGDHVDATAFDPQTGLVFCSTGDGHVYVFHQDAPDQYSLSDTLTTFPGSKTMGLDPKTHRIYVPANDEGSLKLLAFDRQ